MKIYFVMLEVIPSPDNPEDDCTGAYADCFVKADSEMTAVDSAKKYMQEQGWDFAGIEEVFPVERDRYTDDETSLEIYDEACQYGVSGAVYTWDEDD